jgi:beta-glucosidase
LSNNGKLDGKNPFSAVAKVTLNVLNVGEYFGSEVVQLYLSFPLSAGEPPKQLRGFTVVHLKPAQESAVSISLTENDVSVWNQTSRSWVVVSGEYGIYVGSSSRDIKLKFFFIL